MDEDKRSAVHYAALSGQKFIMDAVLASETVSPSHEKADVNAKDKDGLTPLLLASDAQSASNILSLLKHGAEVNATEGLLGMQALHIVIVNGYPSASQSVKALLDYGADVFTQNTFKETPLMLATQQLASLGPKHPHREPYESIVRLLKEAEIAQLSPRQAPFAEQIKKSVPTSSYASR